jgi:polar amino acid transport system substrate-binding protein
MLAMNKWLVSLVVMSVCSVAGCGVTDGKLVVLTSADNPPYEFIRSGEVVGFDVDLMELVAMRLGKKLELVDVPFTSIIPSLRAGKGDLAIASITPTDLRRQTLDFSIPYQNNTSALVIVKTDLFKNVEAGSYFPCELLKGRALGVQLGTHHENDIKTADIDDVTIRRYDSVVNLVAEILKSMRGVGTLYGVVVGLPEARVIVSKNSGLIFYKLKFADSFAIALPKGSELREHVNRVLNELIREGKVSELENKWDILM